MAADTLPVDSSLHTQLLTGRLALLRAAVNRRRLQHQAAGDSVRAFYLATDRALLYEWAGRTGKALQQLENLQSPNRTPEEQEYLDHWICHLRAKQQYRQGLLTLLQWDSLIQTCPSPSAVSPVASGTALRLSAPAEPEIILYPNPATDRLYISYTPVGIPDDQARLRATLHSLQGGEEGEILPSQGVFAGNNEWEVSTAHLPAGMYLVRIFTGAESRTFKLVIVR
ncbi:MAG: T9SS type A sorting domain-containing protein [Bacteroidia bacterium]